MEPCFMHEMMSAHAQSEATLRTPGGRANGGASCACEVVLCINVSFPQCAKSGRQGFLLSDISHLSQFGPVQWGPSKFKPTQ
jgi:hypothetical protein